MRLLCVGGVADGEWNEIRDNFATYHRFTDQRGNGPSATERYTSDYVRETICFGGSLATVTFLRATFLEPSDAWQKLIRGYKVGPSV